MLDFTPELDVYEGEASKRVGACLAAEMRREMAAHLDAAYEARLEMGHDKAAARAGALTVIGDLREVARAEPRDPRDAALRWAPALVLLGFVTASAPFWGQELGPTQFLAFASALLVSFFSGLGRERPMIRPLIQGGMTAFIPFALFLVLGWRGEHLVESLPLLAGLGLSFVVPNVLAHLAAVFLGWIVRQGGSTQGERTLFALRLFAPLVHVGLLLAALSRESVGLANVGQIASIALVGLGMLHRRRLDLRSPLLGVPLAAILFTLWTFVPQGGRVLDTRQMLPQFLMILIVGIGWHLAIQAVVLGVAMGARRIGKLGRAS